MSLVLLMNMGFAAGAAAGGPAISGSRLILVGVGAVLLLLMGA